MTEIHSVGWWIPIKQVKLFLHAFFVAFFCFSLMVMWAVLWLQPYSKTVEQSGNTLSIPQESSSLVIHIVYSDDTIYRYSLLSLQPQKGNITIRNSTSPFSSDDYDRTVQLSKLQLSSLVDYVGGIPVELEKSFAYQKSNINISLEKGTHTLSGEQVLHYLEQNNCNSSILISLLNQLFPKLCEENGQDFFLSLLDLIETDLTVADFDNLIEDVSFLYRIVENPIFVK